jgi:3',5'-cyclic AMP phosphodiesterase CpdA
VFAARARAPKAPGAPIRFVVFGDAGAGTGGQKAVAYRTFQAGPDFVVITGDVVYDRGRIGEYRRRFFPVYNADHAGPRLGAPLLRSTLFVAAPGNHDLSYSDLGRYPDGLAYFLYWNPPGNGPVRHHGAPSSPPLRGNAAAQGAFLAAAGPAFPRAANFSFRYGDAHWVVLDGNPHVRWNDPDLRAWVERELRDAQTAAWRFVAVHHPGFHSSRTHFRQQQMRLLADVFERGRVDIVFSGHVHNYQRSFPLRFAGERRSGEGGDFVQRRTGEVPGRWTLDRRFDGRTVTRPDGVLYVVSGAGGGGLYNRDQEADPGSWQPFTARYVAGTHSLTVVDLEGKRLVLRQISATGEELDRIVVSK